MTPTWVDHERPEENRAVTTLSKPRAKTGSAASRCRAKVEHPAKVFSDPAEVAADPDLSTRDKLAALNSLEQDAKQLAVASAEGMDGGEETQASGRHATGTFARIAVV
jgi:hypothetical protein